MISFFTGITENCLDIGVQRRKVDKKKFAFARNE
jgi:hypothetical protein